MNPWLIQHILYPAYRALKHDDVLGYLEKMRTVQVLEPEEIRGYQWAKTRALLEHAARNVPYYRRVFRDLGAEPGDFRSVEDLTRLPVLTKTLVRENLEDLIADGYPRKDLDGDETGGSTGQNLFFYVDRASSEARRASYLRMNDWLDIELGAKIVNLWGIRFRVTPKERLFSTIRFWFSNIHVLSAYRMDKATVAEYVKQINSYRPTVVMGYPSALSHMSEAMLEDGLRLKPPRVIVVSGETVYDWQRSLIEQAFGAPVYNHYGCCEFGAVARECQQRDGLHVGCERVLMEMIPARDQSADENVKEMIITDLDNYGMPFIRYAIEDYGELVWDECACGLRLPRLRSMIGRTYDVVKAPNGNYLGGTFWGHILKDGVEVFQVRQEEVDRLSISVVPDGEFGESQMNKVVERVHQACGDDMQVDFQIKDRIEPTASGKHRYVISRFSRGSTEPPGAGPESQRRNHHE
jgi:phenylacetate-CoA ligase